MIQPWYLAQARELDKNAIEQARTHQSKLTKPAGSLGKLEELALHFAGWQGTSHPVCANIVIRIFAGDHGVCAQGVSAFPQQVTAQMIDNFIQGGAAINVLAKRLDADFSIVNLGTIEPISNANGLINLQLDKGTADFTTKAAMTEQLMQRALEAGKAQISNCTADLFIGGDMGIGNTTAASAIFSSVLDLSARSTVGPGTGVDKQGLNNKRYAVECALERHCNSLGTPLEVLQNVGGLEIAALVGAYISAAQSGIPIMVDGFICTAAALLAVELNPSVRHWMLFAHRSAEPAHEKALAYLNADPIVDLGMRLGEGSGAAVVVPLLQSALDLHNQMATFSSAHVSGKTS